MKTRKFLVPMISLLFLLLACQILGNTSTNPSEGEENSNSNEQAPTHAATQTPTAEISYPPDDGSRISFEMNIPGQNTKIGFINRFGQVVITPSFVWAGYFEDDRAPVKIAENQFGYIDRQGNFVIQPTFASAHPFSDGAAFVTSVDANGNPSYGLIDIAGKYLIGPIEGEWPYSSPDASDDSIKHYGYIRFYDGFVVANMTGSITYTGNYMDKNGNLMFERDKLVWANRFSEGLAVVDIRKVTPENPNSNYTAVIDTTGKEIFRFDGDCPSFYSEGMLACTKSDSIEKGFVDKTGNMVIPAQYKRAGNFSEGLAAVQSSENDLWGYIDLSGNLVIPFQFWNAHSFINGVAEVELGSGFDPQPGYINKTGQFVFPSFHGFGSEFNEGLAKILRKNADGTTDVDGYIDTNGNIVFQVNK